MKTFIIVDVQNDFCPGGALAVKEADAIIPLINKLQGSFDAVVATQDWHPADHLSFAANHSKKPGEIIELDGLEQVLWPDHCVQNTRGAEFARSLDAKRISRIFRKGTDKRIDSYSGFFDNGHKRSTGLDYYLKKIKAKEIYIAGLATDYCVKHTALDAARLGFNASVIIDACRGVELAEGDIKKALDEMAAAKVKIVLSKDILR